MSNPTPHISRTLLSSYTDYLNTMHSDVYYKKGFRYITTRDRVYQTSICPPRDIETDFLRLTVAGLLYIKRGYAWDGATWAIDTNTNMRASLIHDALIQLVQQGLLDEYWKRDIDMAYYATCRIDGMTLWRAIAHLAMIQQNDWENHHQPTELRAP